MGIASLNTILRKAVLPGTVADLIRESRRRFRLSRTRSAPTGKHHASRRIVGAGPAREIARRARSYREWCGWGGVEDLVRDSDFQRNSRAHRNAPSEGRAKPALRRSCDMDVARAPRAKAGGACRVRGCSGLAPLPLPNPLPEGRGDRSEYVGIPESAGSTEGFRLKPFLLSARTSPPSPFRAGRAAEGWGEGTDFDIALESSLTRLFASKLAPTKSPRLRLRSPASAHARTASARNAPAPPVSPARPWPAAPPGGPPPPGHGRSGRSRWRSGCSARGGR